MNPRRGTASLCLSGEYLLVKTPKIEAPRQSSSERCVSLMSWRESARQRGMLWALHYSTATAPSSSCSSHTAHLSLCRGSAWEQTAQPPSEWLPAAKQRHIALLKQARQGEMFLSHQRVNAIEATDTAKSTPAAFLKSEKLASSCC